MSLFAQIGKVNIYNYFLLCEVILNSITIQEFMFTSIVILYYTILLYHNKRLISIILHMLCLKTYKHVSTSWILVLFIISHILIMPIGAYNDVALVKLC